MPYELDTFREALERTPEFAERTSHVTAWRYRKKLPKPIETLMEFPDLLFALYLISKAAKAKTDKAV